MSHQNLLQFNDNSSTEERLPPPILVWFHWSLQYSSSIRFSIICRQKLFATTASGRRFLRPDKVASLTDFLRKTETHVSFRLQWKLFAGPSLVASSKSSFQQIATSTAEELVADLVITDFFRGSSPSGNVSFPISWDELRRLLGFIRFHISWKSLRPAYTLLVLNLQLKQLVQTSTFLYSQKHASLNFSFTKWSSCSLTFLVAWNSAEFVAGENKLWVSHRYRLRPFMGISVDSK